MTMDWLENENKWIWFHEKSSFLQSHFTIDDFYNIKIIIKCKEYTGNIANPLNSIPNKTYNNQT